MIQSSSASRLMLLPNLAYSWTLRSLRVCLWSEQRRSTSAISACNELLAAASRSRVSVFDRCTNTSPIWLLHAASSKQTNTPSYNNWHSFIHSTFQGRAGLVFIRTEEMRALFALSLSFQPKVLLKHGHICWQFLKKKFQVEKMWIQDSGYHSLYAINSDKAWKNKTLKTKFY